MKKLRAGPDGQNRWVCYECGFTDQYEWRECLVCGNVEPPYTEMELMERQWDKKIFEQCPGKYDAGGCVAKYTFQIAAGGEKCKFCIREQVEKEKTEAENARLKELNREMVSALRWVCVNQCSKGDSPEDKYCDNLSKDPCPVKEIIAKAEVEGE